MTDKLYTQTEALEIVGVRTLTFQNWIKRGIFRASEKTDGGQRRYTAEDVIRLAVINSLALHGVELENAAAVSGRVVAASNWGACIRSLKSSAPKNLWVFVTRPLSGFLEHFSASAYAGQNFNQVRALLAQREDARLAIYDVGPDVWRALQGVRKSEN